MESFVLRRPYVHSGQRPKPDVGNTGNAQRACAFTGKPAGHARMPPGRITTEMHCKEVSMPHAAAFTQRVVIVGEIGFWSNTGPGPRFHPLCTGPFPNLW